MMQTGTPKPSVPSASLNRPFPLGGLAPDEYAVAMM